MLLKFDAALYSRRAVDEAAETFAEFASAEVSEEKGLIVVDLTPIDEPDDELAAEFSNHVLGGMAR